MSEYHLDLWTWLNSVQMRTPTGSRCMSNNYISRCHRRLELVSSRQSVRVRVAVPVGERMPAEWESAPDRWLGPSVTPVEQPSRMRKKCCYGQRNSWSICGSLSPSPNHLSHITNINPFENKVWEVYFYKEVCSFVIIVDYVSACICIRIVVSWLYNIYIYIYIYICRHVKKFLSCYLSPN